jgi:hypothetical protein
MNTQRFLTYAAAAGGLAWFGKLAVLAATDGAESAAVATLYISGLCLLAIGSIGVVLLLLERRSRWLRIAGAAIAPFAWVAIFSLLDSTLVPLTKDHVPEWAKVEAGVFTAAVISVSLAGWALRRVPAARVPATR